IASHHGWSRPHFRSDAVDPEGLTAENTEILLCAMHNFAALNAGRWWSLAGAEAILKTADIIASTQPTTERAEQPALLDKPRDNNALNLHEIALNPSNPAHFLAGSGFAELIAIHDPQSTSRWVDEGLVIESRASDCLDILNQFFNVDNWRFKSDLLTAIQIG